MYYEFIFKLVKKKINFIIVVNRNLNFQPQISNKKLHVNYKFNKIITFNTKYKIVIDGSNFRICEHILKL